MILVVSHLYLLPEHRLLRGGLIIHKSMTNLKEVEPSITVAYFMPLQPSLLKYFKWNWSKLKFESYALDGIRVIPIFYIPRLTKKFPKLDTSLKFLAFKWFSRGEGFKANQVNTVFSQTAFPDAPIAGKIAARMSVKKVVALRGSDIHTFSANNEGVKQGVAQELNSAHKVVSVSRKLEQISDQLFGQSFVDEILYTTCDVNTFHSDLLPKKPLRKWYYVGAIFKSKGIFELIEAFIQLGMQGVDLQLVLIGSGSDTERVKELLKEAKLLERVAFLGQISDRKELASLIEEQDLLVFPSYNEGLPNTVVEAVSQKRAVIASRVGGVEEIASENAAFRLIEPQSSIEIIEAYQSLKEESEEALHHALSANRNLLLSRFSPDAQIETFRKIFNG